MWGTIIGDVMGSRFVGKRGFVSYKFLRWTTQSAVTINTKLCVAVAAALLGWRERGFYPELFDLIREQFNTKHRYVWEDFPWAESNIVVVGAPCG